MAYENQNTTELLEEIRKLLRIADETLDESNYITSLFVAGKIFQALDGRLSSGSDHMPDQWRNNWPVCFCTGCIRCGCNQPWYHHDNVSETEKLEQQV